MSSSSWTEGATGAGVGSAVSAGFRDAAGSVATGDGVTRTASSAGAPRWRCGRTSAQVVEQGRLQSLGRGGQGRLVAGLLHLQAHDRVGQVDVLRLRQAGREG